MTAMARSASDATVTFTTTLTGATTGSATGIAVPAELIEKLGHGQRPAAQVTLNGHRFRTTIGVMGSQHMIPVSADIRKTTGLAAGDAVEVGLTADATPREVIVPPDLTAAFRRQPAAATFFGSLSSSLQRFHIDNINGAKTDDTRQRRVDKAVQLFLDQKPR